MGRTSRVLLRTRALTTPARALSFDGRSWERGADEVGDAIMARLVRRRLSMERSQPWVVLVVLILPLSLALGAALFLGLRWSSEVVLAGAAAMAATLGIGLAFYVERAFLELFVSEGKVLGLSEDACRRVFQRATSASRMLDVMESCGKTPTDAELAAFVR